LDRIKDRPTREWYLRAALEYGWSRDVLILQIKSRLHEREGKALTNFPRALPPPDSDMAEQILKDPYNFDFLTVTAGVIRRRWVRIPSWLEADPALHRAAVEADRFFHQR